MKLPIGVTRKFITAAFGVAAFTGICAAQGQQQNNAAATTNTQNVNVVNIPTVNVAALPGVTVTGTPNVVVTNSATAPVNTQAPNTSASKLVLLTTPGGGVLQKGTMQALVPFVPGQGYGASKYVVPPGQNLVITEVELASLTAGTTFSFLRQNVPGGLVYTNLFVSTVPGTQQFRFTAGAVFPAGTSVTFDNSNNSASDVEVTVHGYLTAN